MNPHLNNEVWCRWLLHLNLHTRFRFSQVWFVHQGAPRAVGCDHGPRLVVVVWMVTVTPLFEGFYFILLDDRYLSCPSYVNIYHAVGLEEIFLMGQLQFGLCLSDYCPKMAMTAEFG